MKFLTACIVLVLCAVACGDVLVLDDGTRVEGKARKVDDQWIVTDAAGHETAVPAGRIVSFELTGNAADIAADRLDQLRRSVANLSDLQQIISRYETFLKIATDADTIAQAKSDLAEWHKRQDDGCVKVGDRWMTLMERDQLAATEAASAAQIRDMMEQGRQDDAAAALQTALTDDPDNPAALYLHALLLADQNQNPAARADLERLAKVVTSHAPTFNNLAVILWRQRLYAAALINYVKAMQASPVDKTILDNVVEALNSLPPAQSSTPIVQQAAQLLAEQDKQLREAQKANGLYRWGSTWVSADDLTRLTAEDAAKQSQLDALQAEYDKTQGSITNDDTRIRQAQAWLQQYTPPPPVGGYQNSMPAAVPPEYFQLQQDLTFAQQARQVGVRHLADVAAQAQKIRQSYSVPKFTGVQQLFGPEGAPIRNETPPATQPG
jgi:tetratricopeptide (TPR) repeat protein